MQDDAARQFLLEHGDPLEKFERRGAVLHGDALVEEQFPHLLRAGGVPAVQHDAVFVGAPAAHVADEVHEPVEIAPRRRGMQVINFERIEK